MERCKNVQKSNEYWFGEVEFIRRTLEDFIFGNIIIDKNYLEQIPKKVIQCINENKREDAEVIMSNHYYKLIRNS